MRPWVRVMFIDILPKILMIERPVPYNSAVRQKDGLLYHKVNPDQVELQPFNPRDRHGGRRSSRPEVLALDEPKFDIFQRADIRAVLDGINYIADHVKESARSKTVRTAHTNDNGCFHSHEEPILMSRTRGGIHFSRSTLQTNQIC